MFSKCSHGEGAMLGAIGARSSWPVATWRYSSRMAAKKTSVILLSELLANAPIDGEPTTPEEDERVVEAQAQIARGDVLSAEKIRRS